MAQVTDRTVGANPTGFDMRTELNNIIGALETDNSGSSEPLNTVAYMKWLDTSNATYYYVKERNHDNTAWVILFRYTVATKVMEVVSNGVVLQDSALVHKTGNETIAGVKTFIDNVGIGVTPSAWAFGNYAIQVGTGVYNIARFAGGATAASFSSNFYSDDISSKYINNGYATNLVHNNGTFTWYTAPSGIAGNPITWTDIMTLGANGDLLVPRMYSQTTASASNCFVDSTGKILRSTSSIKYKTNVEDIDKAYVDSFISNARPIYYKSLSENDNTNWGYWGFIAEEIAEFDKRLVHWSYAKKNIEVEKERNVLDQEAVKDEDGNTVKEATYKTETYSATETINDTDSPMVAEGVMYERVVVLLTAKIKELESRLEVLENVSHS